MKKSKTILWGIVLILAGVLVALDVLDIAEINIFFSGWWTFIIIIPCVIGLFTEREKTGNVIGILIGTVLLLCCQNVLSFSLMWKLLLPAIAIIIGIKMIFNSIFGKADEVMENVHKNGGEVKSGCATFSGSNLNYDGEVFEGAELTAAFGGVKCDLRNAIIEKDCAIKVSATFGGIDILVPSNVNVKTNCNAIFGGVSNKTQLKKENTVTIYVSGTCMFGGVDIK